MGEKKTDVRCPRARCPCGAPGQRLTSQPITARWRHTTPWIGTLSTWTRKTGCGTTSRQALPGVLKGSCENLVFAFQSRVGKGGTHPAAGALASGPGRLPELSGRNSPGDLLQIAYRRAATVLRKDALASGTRGLPRRPTARGGQPADCLKRLGPQS